MHHPRRLSWVVFVITLALALSAAASAFAQSTEKLFFIQRSKNANEVHYDARVNADGTLDARHPVDAYWLRRAKDGSRAPITTLQKIAYGYNVNPGPNGTFTAKLAAFKERPLKLVRVSGRWRAQATIAGKHAYLNRLYIATDESGLIPSVLFVDVFGEEVGTGKAVQERITKK
jgi:Domain of unknown function (DUF4833)